MDRYSLASIAREAMAEVSLQAEFRAEAEVQGQQEKLQRRIDAVRERIHRLRDFAAREGVPLEQIREYQDLQRALEGAPTLRLTPSPPERTAALAGRRAVAQEYGVGEGGTFDLGGREPARSWPADQGETSTSGVASARDGDGDGVGGRPDHRSPQGGGGRYSDHFSSFQNLSLGDVLGKPAKPARRAKVDELWGPEDGQGRAEAARPRRDGGEAQTVSLGELLSTSRRPDLREKIRLAQERMGIRPPVQGQQGPSTSAARAGPSSGDFGGSLGEILRTRDAEEFRERRRFFHSAGSFDEPGPEEREASRTRGRESDRDGDGDGYKNDKSLANRALCRLHRTKYKETSEEAKEECAICLENFKFGQVLAVFGAGCRHTFHQACVVEWFRTGDVRCPLCRYEEKNDYHSNCF